GFSINLSEVASADFVTLAQAKAWKLADGSELLVTMEGTKPTVGGTHEITFKTTSGLSLTVEVIVTDNVAPILSADHQIRYEKDTIKTENDFLTDVHATLDKTGTITSNFNATVDLHTAGVYTVKVNGQDTAGNASNEVIVQVIVTDEPHTKIDTQETEMIQAYGFSISLSEVSNADFIALAQAKAWNLTDGSELLVTMEGSKPTVGGTHEITFKTARGLSLV